MTGALLVAKLGGALAFSPHLRLWLRALEGAAGRVVLVPGGGPFADAVRDAQPRMGYDDAAADEMAQLAMAQYGRALVALGRRLRMAESETAIRAALDTGEVPVWAPLAMTRQDPDLPRSWDVTSDSLALWLARRLGASGVLLVKARGLAGGTAGLLDAAFGRFHAAYAGPVFLAGPEDLPDVLDPDRPPGARLGLA